MIRPIGNEKSTVETSLHILRQKYSRNRATKFSYKNEFNVVSTDTIWAVNDYAIHFKFGTVTII